MAELRNLIVSGNTNISGTLSVGGNTTLNTLNVSNATTLSSTLNVSGTTTLSGYLNSSGGIHINKTNDVDLSTYDTDPLTIGSKEGDNIGIDGNEIMARKNGVASNLYLNNRGGSVYFGGDAHYINSSGQLYGSSQHLLINGVTWDSNWHWSGQGGQPTWLWGSNDGVNMYVWNPGNFSVDIASRANQLQAFTADNFTGGDHYIKAIREDGWWMRLKTWYNGGAATTNYVRVGYADAAGTAYNIPTSNIGGNIWIS